MFRFFQKRHSKLGVFAVLFIIVIVISGIALNHSNELGLNKHYIQSDWLLDLYQINPANDPIAFESEENWITQIEDHIYFNDVELANDVTKLIGVIKSEDLIIVAYDTRLTLLTDQGELVEELTGVEGVPADMNEIGVDDQGNVVIKTTNKYYTVNIDELDWKENDQLDANWSVAATLPEYLNTELLKKYRGSGLSVERVLFDLHSGRIVGKWGVYFVDAIAIILLILAVTGIYMWWVRK